jgi:peptidoglycan/LPS O-acetylase OafA/YrhL
MPIRHHFATLDGLRGDAAIIVVTFHALHPFDHPLDSSPSLTPHAPLAVDFFFGLSGVVIGYAYLTRLLTVMSLREFAAARVIRLYPLLLAGTMIGALVFLAKSSGHLGELFTVVVLELALLPCSLGLGDGWPAGMAPLDTPAWSLSFEVLS